MEPAINRREGPIMPNKERAMDDRLAPRYRMRDGLEGTTSSCNRRMGESLSEGTEVASMFLNRMGRS